MNKQKPVVLFDMDGTLTPPREKINNDVINSLKQLSTFAKIGIISGSDLEYIEEQCAAMFCVGGVDINAVDLLPCNGTKLLRWNNTSYQMIHEADMLQEIGKNTYKQILTKIFDWQAQITRLYPDLPFTGTFVQYRGSLLNWCPIGRAASLEQRKDWNKWDQDWRIRVTYSEELRKFLDILPKKITVALGGSTSFDIYPEGWNKTYGLQHYAGEEVFFIGDKCEPGGNDWHIYEELQPAGRSWKTSGPEETVQLIGDIIKKLK